MKVLCVAEKNSIGKAVSGILGGGRTQTRNSPYKFVKNYEFKFDFGQGLCDVVMTSVAGHLTNVEFPESYGWNNCVPGKLFDAPLVEQYSKDMDKVAKNIETLSKSCDQLMIWTDCDREGEYIGYEILEAAKKGNRNFNLDNTWRAQFSHLENRHIFRAAKNPIKLDKQAIDAVRTRIELDLRTGAAFTRFLCDVFRAQRLRKEVDTVSYGSCQFPTLGFVVDRFKRIVNFKPEEFWYIDLTIKKPELVRFNWKRTRLFDRMATLVIYQNCMKTDKGRISGIKSQPTTKYKPLPLTTVQLQKCCSMYFKMSAKDSLAAAEKLYQGGFISYPRTETDSFPHAMDLKALISNQAQDNTWGNYATSLLENNRYSQPRAGKHDDKAHPPIHPVTHTTGANLTLNEKKVYEFVVRHFLACCSQDAKGQTTTVELQWVSEEFSASGLVVLEKNFLEIYTYQKWESSAQLPQFQINEEVPLSSAEMKSGKTAPPNAMTETELIALMDSNGIGTDATIAEHIEKIVHREYITKATKNKTTTLVPTTLGVSLVDGFDSMNLNNSLTKPFLRKSMEIELKEICEGKKTKGDVMETMINLYRESYIVSVRQKAAILDAYVKNHNEAAAAN